MNIITVKNVLQTYVIANNLVNMIKNFHTKKYFSENIHFINFISNFMEKYLINKKINMSKIIFISYSLSPVRSNIF